MAELALAISYKIHFMACRSFSSQLMGEAEISESLEGVLLLTSFAQSHHGDSDIFSLGLII